MKEKYFDMEEGFEIDIDMAEKIDGLEHKNIYCSYQYDTNTVEFYLTKNARDKIDNMNETNYQKAINLLDFDDDSFSKIDTIVYRNETVEEMKILIEKYFKDFLKRLDKVLNNEL